MNLRSGLLLILGLAGAFSPACSSAPPPAAPSSTTGPPTTSAPPPSPVSIPTDLWLPLTVEQDCRANNRPLAVGTYQVHPVVEDRDGKPSVTKLVLATKKGVSVAEAESGKAADGSVVVNVIGFATLKDPHPTTRARFSTNDEIATIWIGLAGDTREWASEGLKLAAPGTGKAGTPSKKR